MSKGHNKKRNVGIVYEQLVVTVSRAMVEKDQTTANKALEIIKEYFSPKTELYREFRLFSALVKTHVTSDALASRILQETKNACHTYDVEKLNREKSSLISEINRTFHKDTFYKTPVKNYKLLATIHTLMHEWRKDTPNIGLRVKYETHLHEWLLTKKEETSISEMKTPSVNDLTVRLMREAFNKKYGESLNASQRDFIRKLALEDNSDDISEIMAEQKNIALNLIKRYKIQCDSEYVREKIPAVHTMIENLDVSNTADENIARFLTVTQLCDELMEKEDE